MQPEVAQALVLRVQPGDAIVLKCLGTITREEVVRFRAEWERAISGSGLAETPVLILDAGTDLTILRKDESEAA